MPEKGVAWQFPAALIDALSRPDLKASPTLAAGDVQLSKDGAAFANITTLPSATGTNIEVNLSATEMDADTIAIQFIDQTDPKEWDDVSYSESTETLQSTLDNIEADTLPLGYFGSHGFGIYLDTNAANTNTVDGTDGIFSNPVSTPAAARTLADSIGVNKYYILGNSNVTLGATHEDWEFIGYGSNTANVIDLGSRDVDRSIFINVCIEGTQGGTERIDAVGCALRDPGAGDTTLHIHAVDCGIVDRIQVDTSNDNVFVNWHSLVAGTNAPIIQATGASGTISMRNGSGGIEFESLSASHNVSVETDGQVIFASDCNVNATIALRGNLTITDNTAGMNNLSRDAALNGAHIADSVGEELVTGHTTNNTFGKILKGISEGWVADEGSVNDASATTTGFISDLTQVTDSFFSDATVVFITGALKGQSRLVSAYNGTTKAFTFDEAFTSAPANTTQFIVLAQHTHTITSITADIDANSTQLAAIVSDLDNGTDGLGALKVLIDTVNTDLSNGTDGLGALKTLIDTVNTDLSNGTDGLGALKALIDDLAIKKNTAFSNFEFLMVLTSDHVTPATGLTVTGQRSIDGGAFASVSGAIAEVSNGIYQFDALAADTNGDVITWRFSSGTADDTFVTFKTVT